MSWWPWKRHRAEEFMPGGTDGELLIECSCGGHAQIRRLDDGSTLIEVATCRRWRALRKQQQKAFPMAKANRRQT